MFVLPGAATEALLRAAGFDVATSRVECYGMAGSFGYKKKYYDLSMAVGQDLFQQVAEAEANGTRVLVATGTSCHEQLHAGLKRPVFIPPSFWPASCKAVDANDLRTFLIQEIARLPAPVSLQLAACGFALSDI